MRWCLVSLFLLAGIEIASAQATIEGTVALPNKEFAPVAVRRYEIVSKGSVLATNPPVAVVYLEGNFAKAAPQKPKQIAQKDLGFFPALLAVQTGTTVEFPNEDKIYHNIFSYSPPKRFDLGRYRPDERPVPSVRFDKAGLVILRCDIHEHMRGLILVLDTPHFVTTQPQGHFRLTNLPPGKFTLKAWIDSRTTRERRVELKAGSALRVDFP